MDLHRKDMVVYCLVSAAGMENSQFDHVMSCLEKCFEVGFWLFSFLSFDMDLFFFKCLLNLLQY